MAGQSAIQMLMDAVKRAQGGMPSMNGSSQYDLSNDFMKAPAPTSQDDASGDVKPDSSFQKFAMLLAPKTTQGVMQGKGFMGMGGSSGGGDAMKSMATSAMKGGAG